MLPVFAAMLAEGSRETTRASIPTLTVSQVEAYWSAIQALAPEAVKQPVDEAAPTETLIAAIEAGDSLHEALRGLAWRGWSVDSLTKLIDRSAARASDPKRWADRRADIERYVASAVGKRCEEAKRAFGQVPAALPTGAKPLGEPPPFDPEARRVAQLEEARRIGEGDDEADLLPTIMNLKSMVNDLVYVGSTGAVVHLPTCRVRRGDRARDEFKASKETWVDANGNMREAEAYKLWLEDRRRKTVDVITWSPRHGAFCDAPEREEGGSKAVNLWGGWNAPDAPEDWRERLGPWREHLAYLIPDPGERAEFEQWLAHIAQKPGELPHRFYLMIAKHQGVGRNWITCVLARVFRGYVAADLSIAKLLAGGFTGRLGRKVLVTVDEAKEGTSGNKYQKADALKQMITTDVREINPKYGVPSVQFNCARWIMLSNHEDAIPLDKMDRRCVVIRNPDKPRDAAYYNRIYAAVHDPKFIGAVWEYLRTLDISTFNAQKPAALTNSKRSVIAAMESETAKALRQFFSAWPGQLVDRETLINFVADETDGQRPHPKHFRECLEEIGAVVRQRRVRIYGKDQTIIAVGMSREELDGLAASEIVRHIDEARATATFGAE